MDNEKKIEIPFGAFDSELIRQEISIPNGFNAVIDGNKIILTRAESKDETIRKILIHFFSRPEITSLEYWEGISNKEALAWLEKQDPKKHEEELEKAYKTADKVQYRRGYEDATKEMEKQGEQKPAWSEEDDVMIYKLLAVVELYYDRDGDDLDKQSCIDWLKALKQRIGVKL